MPSTPSRSRDPRPNVLADGATPNRLSTQPSATSQGSAGRPVAPRAAQPSNRLSMPNRATRSAMPADPRFESRGRRAPSLATIVVIGFLLVTAFRLIVALAGH